MARREYLISRRNLFKKSFSAGAVAVADTLFRPSRVAASDGMRGPESAFLGDLTGNAVIIFNSLSRILVAPLHANNGPIYFHPIYNQNTANPENNWAGVEQHRPISFSNLDNRVGADIFPTGIVGETVIRGREGGRVAYSIYQEERNQWQGGFPFPIDGSPSESAKATYYFEGLGVGQPVFIVDPDSGRQMIREFNGQPAVFFGDSSGKLAVQLPHAKGDVRVQLVFNVDPGVNVIVRRRYSKTSELELPVGVVKPGVPGAY